MTLAGIMERLAAFPEEGGQRLPVTESRSLGKAVIWSRGVGGEQERLIDPQTLSVLSGIGRPLDGSMLDRENDATLDRTFSVEYLLARKN